MSTMHSTVATVAKRSHSAQIWDFGKATLIHRNTIVTCDCVVHLAFCSRKTHKHLAVRKKDNATAIMPLYF